MKLFYHIVLLFILFTSCQPNEHVEDSEVDAYLYAEEDYDRSGRQLEKDLQASRLTIDSSMAFATLPVISEDVVQALHHQLAYFNKRRTLLRNGGQQFQSDDIYYQEQDLYDVCKTMQHIGVIAPDQMKEYLDFYEVSGQKGYGNVKFTGYYTPVYEWSTKPSKRFKYAVYKRPETEGLLPTRKEIEVDSVLAEKGLEMAYAEYYAQIFNLQLQGSGYVDLDGKLKYFNFVSSNGYKGRRRVSIDSNLVVGLEDQVKKYIEYPGYVFFEAQPFQSPKGNVRIPLTPLVSVAADPRVFPTGTILLVALPTIDEENKQLLGHQFQYVIVQDIGGGIRGPGHLDLYFGVGGIAGKAARRFHYFGKAWMMLPKTVQEYNSELPSNDQLVKAME